MAMNVQNLIMRMQNDSAQPPLNMDTASQAVVKDWLDEQLQPDLRGLAREIDKVQGNVKLSDSGKADKLGELGRDFLKRFAWVKTELSNREAVLTRNRATLFSVESPVQNEILRYFRSLEIRNDFKDADRDERVALFLRACEKNDTETLFAILNAPGEPLVDEEIKHRGLTGRSKRLFGEPGGLVDIVEQQQRLREYLESWRQMISVMLRDMGVPAPTIGEVLGGTMTSSAGLPDGSAPLNGAAWKQQTAAMGV